MSERGAMAAALLALLTVAGCADGAEPVASIRLPGGPTRGTMTWDEAMTARTGLTTLARQPAAPAR